MSDLWERLERDVLPLVSRPGRYIGGERNASHKRADEARLTFLLAFPDVYEIGMSHLGLRVLYDILNRRPEIACERAFAPWPDMEERLREEKIPLFSLESRVPLSDFDVVGFTLQYELQYTNILTMLDLAGVPLRSSARTERDPLVIAGGPCAFNPEPVCALFDLLVIGDGESAVLDIADLVLEAKEEGLGRPELLARAAQIPGVYVPSLHAPTYDNGRFAGTVPTDGTAQEVICRRVEPRLGYSTHPALPLVPLTEATHDRLSIEIARGCTRGCRFCQAGMTTRPVRARPVDDLGRLVEEGIAGSGYDEVSLLALSPSDYEHLPELVSALNRTLFDRRVGISLPSLRLDRFTLDVARGIGRVRKAGLTFAPEAGTQRLRDVINKNETEEHILETVDTAFGLGWNRVKLYFMIGLPTEADEDIEGIGDLVEKLRRLARARKRGARINVSISPFVPKPHTPFQWERQDSIGETRRKEEIIRQALRVRGVKLSLRDPSVSFLEGVLARGDRGLLPVIESAWRGGARFDSWTETFNFGVWRAAFDEAGIDPEEYMEPIDLEAPLFWDHIGAGPTKASLLAERERAMRGETTPDCREVGCLSCGACGSEGRAPREMPAGREADRDRGEPVKTYGRTARRRSGGRNGLHDRWRVKYAKGEKLRFVSHLDVIRAISRALTISRLPVAFSQGFNPHHKLSFGPPLPVGATGEAEYFDMELSRGVSESEVDAELGAAMPEGLSIIETRPLRAKTSVAAATAAAEYVIRDVQSLSGLGGAEIDERIGALRLIEAAVVPKGEGTKEVRPADSILEFEVLEPDPPALRVVLAAGEAGSLRPVDVVGLLRDPESAPARLCRIHRTKLLRRGLTGREGLEPMERVD